MSKYSLGWRNWSEGISWGRALRDFRDFILLLLIIYILVSGFSLIAVAMGEDIPYMPFWHKPWQWLFQLFHWV